MNAEVAAGLFGAYAAVMSIIVVYQTLALQTVVDGLDRALAGQGGTERGYQEKRRKRANSLLRQAAFFVVAVTAAFFLVASYSDFIAGLVDPSDAPREAFTYPVWILRVLFVAVTAYYAVRIGSHSYIRHNAGFRRSSVEG